MYLRTWRGRAPAVLVDHERCCVRVMRQMSKDEKIMAARYALTSKLKVRRGLVRACLCVCVLLCVFACVFLSLCALYAALRRVPGIARVGWHSMT